MNPPLASLYRSDGLQSVAEAPAIIEALLRLQHTSAALAAAGSAAEIADIVMDEALALFGAFGGALYVVEGDELQMLTSRGIADDLLEGYRRLPRTHGLPLAAALREGRFLFLEDRRAAVADYPGLESIIDVADSSAYLPLILAGERLGGIGLTFAKARRFSTYERSYATTAAQQCALALHRVRLADEQKRLRAEAEEVARSQRVLAEAMRTARAQLEAVFEAMADGVMVVDATGAVVLLNEAMARTAEYPSAESMRKNMQHYTSEFDLYEMNGPHVGLDNWPAMRVLRGEVITEWKLRARRRLDGREWVFGFSGQPIKDEAGRQPLALIVMRDLTGKVRNEARLAASQRKFSMIFDSAPFPICLIELPSATIVDVNHAFVTVFEWPREEIVGKNSKSSGLHLDLDGPGLVAETLARSGRVRDLETTMVTKSGRSLTVSNNIDLLELDGTSHALVTLQDVTEHRQAEQDLREALHVRDDFLAIAGHELRTPLAALTLHIQSIQRARRMNSATPKIDERLARAEAAGLRLERLIDQMLDVSRITGGRLNLEPHLFDLDDLVHEVVDRLIDQASRAGSTLDVALTPGVRGRWDRLRIDQVLTNFVEASGGRITVTSALGEGTLFTVTLPAVSREGLERVGGSLADQQRSRRSRRREAVGDLARRDDLHAAHAG